MVTIREMTLLLLGVGAECTPQEMANIDGLIAQLAPRHDGNEHDARILLFTWAAALKSKKLLFNYEELFMSLSRHGKLSGEQECEFCDRLTLMYWLERGEWEQFEEHLTASEKKSNARPASLQDLRYAYLEKKRRSRSDGGAA